MANVLNRITKEYKRSVDTPEFDVAGWIVNPDVSSVIDFPTKYWAIVGDSVSLMSQAERDDVDATEVAAALAADQVSNKSRLDDERVLKALALVVKDEINILRAQHSLADRTNNQVLNAIKAKVDTI